MRRLFFCCLLHVHLVLLVHAAPEKPELPVSIVASNALALTTTSGSASLPVDVSLDWSRPQPRMTRAVVIFHGKGRDVDGYYRTAMQASKLAGGDAPNTTIVVAPQFLIEEDVRAHLLPENVLRWRQGAWESGAAASAPIALSSFQVVDFIIQRLSDQQLFPNLRTIVLAGHSGGGQAIQRYAIVGRAEQFTRPNIHLKYVVANPSSYFYFDDKRPKFREDSLHYELPAVRNCREFNHWRYGPLHVHEDYVQQSASQGWAALEDFFTGKDVVYLLGTDDIDPHEKDLDISCAAEMQGPNRFLRGQAYYGQLHEQHRTSWNQHMWFVPDVAHSAARMITSQCGVAAIFDQSSCPDQ